MIEINGVVSSQGSLTSLAQTNNYLQELFVICDLICDAAVAAADQSGHFCFSKLKFATSAIGIARNGIIARRRRGDMETGDWGLALSKCPLQTFSEDVATT